MPARAWRWWLFIPIGVLALALLAIAALMVFVDPNRYRPRIEAELRARTGWSVDLGELHWRGWPHLAVELGAGSVGAAAASPALRWRAMAVSARWPPLLHGQLVLDRLEIDGLQATLAVDGGGRGNWQVLRDRFQSAQSASVTAANREWQLAALVLRDADVDFTDERSTAHAHASNLQLTLALATDGDAVRVRDLQLEMQLAGGPLPGRVPVSFAAPTLIWTAATLVLPTWTLRAGNATLEGSESEPVRFAPLRASGQLHARTESLRTLLATLGKSPPPTRDRTVLGATELTAQWSWQDAALDLPALAVTADGTRLAGLAHWASSPHPRLTLQMTGGAIDLDRYLTPPDYVSPPFQLPALALKSLPVAGTLSFESARVQGVVLKGVRLQLLSEAP